MYKISGIIFSSDDGLNCDDKELFKLILPPNKKIKGVDMQILHLHKDCGCYEYHQTEDNIRKKSDESDSDEIEECDCNEERYKEPQKCDCDITRSDVTSSSSRKRQVVNSGKKGTGYQTNVRTKYLDDDEPGSPKGMGYQKIISSKSLSGESQDHLPKLPRGGMEITVTESDRNVRPPSKHNELLQERDPSYSKIEPQKYRVPQAKKTPNFLEQVNPTGSEIDITSYRAPPSKSSLKPDQSRQLPKVSTSSPQPRVQLNPTGSVIDVESYKKPSTTKATMSAKKSSLKQQTPPTNGAAEYIKGESKIEIEQKVTEFERIRSKDADSSANTQVPKISSSQQKPQVSPKRSTSKVKSNQSIFQKKSEEGLRPKVSGSTIKKTDSAMSTTKSIVSEKRSGNLPRVGSSKLSTKPSNISSEKLIRTPEKSNQNLPPSRAASKNLPVPPPVITKSTASTKTIRTPAKSNQNLPKSLSTASTKTLSTPVKSNQSFQPSRTASQNLPVAPPVVTKSKSSTTAIRTPEKSNQNLTPSKSASQNLRAAPPVVSKSRSTTSAKDTKSSTSIKDYKSSTGPRTMSTSSIGSRSIPLKSTSNSSVVSFKEPLPSKQSIKYQGAAKSSSNITAASGDRSKLKVSSAAKLDADDEITKTLNFKIKFKHCKKTCSEVISKKSASNCRCCDLAHPQRLYIILAPSKKNEGECDDVPSDYKCYTITKESDFPETASSSTEYFNDRSTEMTDDVSESAPNGRSSKYEVEIKFMNCICEDNKDVLNNNNELICPKGRNNKNNSGRMYLVLSPPKYK